MFSSSSKINYTKKYDSVKKELDISNNNLDKENLPELIQFLETHLDIQVLKIKDSFFGDQACTISLFQIIAKLKQLTELSIELSVSNACAGEINLANTIASLDNLKSFEIKSEGMQEQNILALMPILATKALSALSLKITCLNANTIKAICNAIKDNLSLQSLSINEYVGMNVVSRSKFDDECAILFAQVIASLKNLSTFNLSEVCFTEIGVNALMSVLTPENLPRLQSLVITPTSNSNTNTIMNEACIVAIANVVKNFGMLHHWEITAYTSTIGKDGIIAISEALQRLPYLLNFKLSSFHLKPNDLSPLIPVLAMLTNLNSLTLSVHLGNNSLALASVLPKLKHLQFLNIFAYDLNEDAACVLSGAVINLKKLHTYNLSGQAVGLSANNSELAYNLHRTVDPDWRSFEARKRGLKIIPSLYTLSKFSVFVHGINQDADVQNKVNNNGLLADLLKPFAYGKQQ